MEKFSKFLTKDRQKQRNLSDILKFIVEKGVTTRREIERETGFSWGAVSESVTELLSRGYLTEQMPSEKVVGRTSTVLSARGDLIVSIGVDINITGITARVLGFDLNKLWKKTLPFTATTQEELFTEIIAVCSEAFAFCEGRYKVLSLGIAMQGKVDTENGISVYFPNIPDWESINVKELLEEKFSVFTTLEHDPKCLLVAKSHRENFRDALLLRIDNGIGLSVIQDGKIMNDFGKMEIGHTVAVPSGERCACGRRGCLEAYASILGMERRSGLKLEALLSATDNPVLSEACEHLAVAIYNLCMLFSPQKIILTGKLSEYPEYTERLCEHLRLISDDEMPEIEIDNNISASFGAALISIKNVLKSNEI